MFPHRVLPDGSFSDQGTRGVLTGNRGILHHPDGSDSGARWRHKAWISCTLNEKPGRPKLPLTAPGHYTPLFFHDEAVALAAGHRPCAYCRREAYNAFRTLWTREYGPARAPEMDALLHRARLTPDRQQRRTQTLCHALPDHSFILHAGQPGRIAGDQLLPFTAAGYGAPLPRPEGEVTVITPEPFLRLLAAGYLPALSRAEDRASWPPQP